VSGIVVQLVTPALLPLAGWGLALLLRLAILGLFRSASDFFPFFSVNQKPSGTDRFPTVAALRC
jgi:hypothetical protein